jgi:organic hydroperoxide reductase OsmC/OhrA
MHDGSRTMARFPMEYAVEVHKTDGATMEVTAGNRPHLVVGAPAELGGSDVWWSPEHLLVSAAASCMAATFSALAERAKLRVGGLRCRAHGRLDRVEGRVAFSSMHLALEITVLADDVERARGVAADAKTHCFVAASLRCPVELVVDVKAS